MTTRVLLYTVVTWVLFVIAGTMNDWLARVSSSPMLSEYGSHICSTMRLLAFVIAAAYIFVKALEIRRYTQADLLFIGLFWFAMTVLFEFVYRHYFRRYSWGAVLGDYNFLNGRLMASVLLAKLFGPYLFGLRRHIIIRRAHIDENSGIS